MNCSLMTDPRRDPAMELLCLLSIEPQPFDELAQDLGAKPWQIDLLIHDLRTRGFVIHVEGRWSGDFAFIPRAAWRECKMAAMLYSKRAHCPHPQTSIG